VTVTTRQSTKEKPFSMNTIHADNELKNWSNEMYLMQEQLARAHMDARLREARELRRGSQLSRAQRLARKAERASQQARLLLARSF
jgi:hypothetical protein